MVDYRTITNTEATKQMVAEWKNKKIKEIEEERIKSFETKKQAAFDALTKKQDDERIALGILWQTYEDNNYTIN